MNDVIASRVVPVGNGLMDKLCRLQGCVDRLNEHRAIVIEIDQSRPDLDTLRGFIKQVRQHGFPFPNARASCGAFANDTNAVTTVDAGFFATPRHERGEAGR